MQTTNTHSKVVGYILYLLTAGLLGFGVLYDFWTLNSQVSEINHAKFRPPRLR